jgi:hypothetical protein
MAKKRAAKRAAKRPAKPAEYPSPELVALLAGSLQQHSLRGVVDALATAIEQCATTRVHVPAAQFDRCSVYTNDLLNAVQVLRGDLY